MQLDSAREHGDGHRIAKFRQFVIRQNVPNDQKFRPRPGGLDRATGIGT